MTAIVRRLALATALALGSTASAALAAPAAAEDPATKVRKMDRSAPLPAPMQGRWVEAEDPSVELVVSGGEIICFSRVVDYDFKEVSEEDGALTVSLGVHDSSREDSFQRENITGLVITPEGDFHVYNVKFAATFKRAR